MGWIKSDLTILPESGPVSSCKPWLEASLAKGDEPLILASDNGIAPFVIKKTLFLTVLKFIGADTSSATGMIFPYEDGAPPVLHMDDLPKGIDLIDMRRLPKDQAAMFFPNHKSTIIREDGICYALDLPQVYAKYWMSLKKKFRMNLRTSQNRIIRKRGTGSMEISVMRISKGNWDKAFAIGKKIAEKSWKGRQGLSVFFRIDRIKFLLDLLMKGVKQDAFVFYLNSTPIAIRWVIRNNEDVLLYLVEYDDNMRAYRPGHLLLNYLLKYYWDRGYRSFDFGYGDSAHKKDWAARGRPLVRCMIPLTHRGRFFLSYQKMRWRIGRMKRVLTKQKQVKRKPTLGLAHFILDMGNGGAKSWFADYPKISESKG